MAIEVFVHDKGVPEVMDIVNDLRKQGLIQGKDFDFAYQPPVWNTFGHEPPTRRCTTFTFYKEKYAMLFTIKYGT